MLMNWIMKNQFINEHKVVPIGNNPQMDQQFSKVRNQFPYSFIQSIFIVY